jgi:peroxiredoxin
MKIFEKQTRNLKVGQKAEDFPLEENLSLADLKGHPIFLVFWKTL